LVYFQTLISTDYFKLNHAKIDTYSIVNSDRKLVIIEENIKYMIQNKKLMNKLTFDNNLCILFELYIHFASVNQNSEFIKKIFSEANEYLNTSISFVIMHFNSLCKGKSNE